jgi:hypothetical protein
MSKYVIEIEEKPLCVFDKDTQTFFPRLWRVKGFNSLVLDEEGLSRLEELNSDYINENFGDLQDAAYQRGLEDAWKAARKIVCDEGIDMNTLCTIFRRGCSDSIIRDYSASEAITKLKAYEEKQKADDKVKVGDEVEWDNDFTGDRFIVTRIYQPYGKKEQCDGIDDDGDVYRAVLIESLVKTGRHFDIQRILEDMKHD